MLIGLEESIVCLLGGNRIADMSASHSEATSKKKAEKIAACFFMKTSKTMRIKMSIMEFNLKSSFPYKSRGTSGGSNK